MFIAPAPRILYYRLQASTINGCYLVTQPQVGPACQPSCGRQDTRPAARRGVREVAGSAGDSRVEEGAGGGHGKSGFIFPILPLTGSPFSVSAVCLLRLLCPWKFIDIAGDDHPCGVLPGASPNPIAGVDGGLVADGARTEIRVPCPVAGADRLGQRLAVLVCTRQATQLPSHARADTGDEKRHGGLLRLHTCGRVQRQRR
jgi:hypothetical protein